jgi:SAM domain (Sterile alpha motif)/Adenylate and Guanylate cyclase catalytic domain
MPDWIGDQLAGVGTEATRVLGRNAQIAVARRARGERGTRPAAVMRPIPGHARSISPSLIPAGRIQPMDVGAWLRDLGLGQYETVFRESEIDAEVLPDLTEGDLYQLGVPMGHRKRLLRAIAAFETAETTKPPGPAPVSSPAAAERRPITVMFCDLVGSTSMAAKLDAEDWRDLVGAYLDEASAAVTGLGGHVSKKLGDGLMALFGYPQAQENDAERAVRTALAIQRALVEINARNASKGTQELSDRP